MTQAAIHSVLQETRRFPPPGGFAAQANVPAAAEATARAAAAADFEAFWATQAQALQWRKPWQKTLEWRPPHAKWFVGGLLNVCENCVDRHAATAKRNQAAIIWEGEDGAQRVLTYGLLLREVAQFANVLRSLGVGTGDRVALYMPLIPELAVAMLACARIGATHSVIFGGFSADSLRDRIHDAGAKVLVTTDGGRRRGNIVPLKHAADEAVAQCPGVKNVVVVRRTGENVPMRGGRDHWWHELMAAASPVCEPVPVESNHPLFILYTSGTTGKPKGVVHGSGGYLTGTAYTAREVFDLKPTDLYWCTADIGWVTGHSYVVYGILANGATLLMYEGAPNFPEPDRFWRLIDKYRVTVFYTAPTAIRSFMRWGEQWPRKHDLTSLRLLGTVGEPINPEAWMWYRSVIGGERCPIVDTWWQTETGAIMISPLPGATPTKPGSCTKPLPGVFAAVVDREGNPVQTNEGGYLVLTKPWPSMLQTVWGDDERYRTNYWERYAKQGYYFAGDGARCDEDGYFWVMGRVDDVLNVSGHRLGTMEVESALVSHPAVAEAAVVGRPDDIKGQAVFAFVTLKQGQAGNDALKDTLKAHVAKEIGALARPDDIRFTDALPKTRSGKIMRRLLRDIAAGTAPVGDTTTLEDLGVLAKLQEDEE